MALKSVLDETPSAGGGGLVIWLDYATLLETGEWFVDYNTDVHNLDTDQTDALDYLFKKGWEGTGADQYQALYDVFLEEIYRPFFENKLLSIKNTTMDAITGSCKLMNLCDDFHLAFDSDDYQAEIRFGRHGGGQLMYDSTYKNTIITYCEDVSTATDEEDELLEEAIAAVSDLHYPQFAIGINIVKGRKEFFIKKQKRIDNYKETFTDYTERVVQFDQDVADAYNAEVDENVKAAYDYVPLKEVEPWEVDCARQWVATDDFESMIDFIRSSPKDASVWTDGRAEAITIIYINAYYGEDVDVLTAFFNQFCITFYDGVGSRDDSYVIDDPGGQHRETRTIHFDKYIIATDPAVVERMDDYMDKYTYGEAWTALTEKYYVTVDYSNGERPADKITTISVSQADDGSLITQVSINNANGDTLGSASVAEHNKWDDMYGKGVLQEKRSNGVSESEIDDFHNSDEGLMCRAANPDYKLTDDEEKRVEKLVDEHWEEHPEEKEYADLIIKYSNKSFSNNDYYQVHTMTFEEYYTDKTKKDFDREVFERAVNYYVIDQKVSEGAAFVDGFTQTGYNLGKAINALDDKVTDKLHLDEIFVPSEHALAVEQSNEEMRQIEDLVRQAEQTQNSEWYTGGHVTERVVTTVAASALFGGSEIAGAVAEKVGGGILAKYATEYAVTVACDTVADTVVDTVPEMINNSYAGMSQEEVWDNAKDNFLGNLGINALTAGVGTGVKILGDAGDGAKALENTVDTATKTLDNGADAFKLVDKGTDAVKIAGTGTDALKITDDTADAVKAASKATEEAAEQAANAAMTTSKATDTAIAVTKTADTAKTAEHIAESTKAADTAKTAEHIVESTKAADTAKTAEHIAESTKAADTAKTAEHVAESTKAADTAKTAEHVAESTKAADTIKTADNVADVPYVVNTADHVTDSVKEAAHTSDVSKITAKAADADDAVEISIEKSKTIGDQNCIVKKADPSPETYIHAGKNVSGDSDGLASLYRSPEYKTSYGKSIENTEFFKENGGLDASDYISIHSRKHMYNPDTPSTPKKTQYGKDVNVGKLCEDTIMNPDEIIHNIDQNVMIYKKKYPFNISTSETPTGTHRVFIPLNIQGKKTIRMSQFPLFEGN